MDPLRSVGHFCLRGHPSLMMLSQRYSCARMTTGRPTPDRLRYASGRTTHAKRARFPLGLRRIQSNRQAGPAREIARMRRAVFHPEPVPQDAAFANATKPVCFSTAPALWPGGISSPRSVVCCGQSAAKRATSGRLGGGRGGAKKGIVRLGQRNRCGRRWDKADERELDFREREVDGALQATLLPLCQKIAFCSRLFSG
jgi:hypothetical protein